MRNILSAGAEKVCISTAAHESPNLISDIANKFGTQSVVVSIDVKRNIFGKYEVYKNCGKKNTGKNPVDFAIEMEKKGAGEIIVNSIDRDGTMKGYDIELIMRISERVNIPVIALGGASNYDDLKMPIFDANCSASAAGSLFVFHGPRKAVLINYPQMNF